MKATINTTKEVLLVLVGSFGTLSGISLHIDLAAAAIFFILCIMCMYFAKA